MLHMGASGGRRRADVATSSRGPLVALGATFAGALIGAGAWFFLVRAAIDFGGSAKNGKAAAWIFMLGATLGAIACLVLVLVLATRGLTALGLIGRSKTPTATHGRRASHK
jgi:hypothetical protein